MHLHQKTYDVCIQRCQSINSDQWHNLLIVQYCKKKVHVLIDGQLQKSTSRHIFEKLRICIVRCLYSVYFKEIYLFENFIFGIRCSSFTSQLSCSHPLASLEKKRNTLFQQSYLYIAFQNLVYVEASLFGCYIKQFST